VSQLLETSRPKSLERPGRVRPWPPSLLGLALPVCRFGFTEVTDIFDLRARRRTSVVFLLRDTVWLSPTLWLLCWRSQRTCGNSPCGDSNDSQYLLYGGRCPDLRHRFRAADHTPGKIAAANGTSVSLRNHDQPAGVCVAFPGILDAGERNPLGLDAQRAAGCAVHHLLKRVGEDVPRRHAPGS
jgi:hypothetical protein